MGKPWFEIGRYGSVGFELIVTILIPAAIGNWLDERYWNRGGWGAAVGFLVGVAVGFRNLLRAAKTMQRDIERAEANDPEAGRWTVDESWVHKDEAPMSERDRHGGDRHDHEGKDGPPN
ncbi:MAG TPA: AtpZ/AtpI family protein [Polyangiaceae bacterium]|nr:AtpZ/AtpI family protein [Polyangiaceae bacterium]